MKKALLNSVKLVLLLCSFAVVAHGGIAPDDSGTKDPNQGPCGGGSHICLRPDGQLNACVTC